MATVKATCNPLFEMKFSQEDLRAAFERNKQLAQLNPDYHMGCAATKSIPSGKLPSPLMNEGTRSKYRNVKVEYEGMKFDSKHELRCWRDLKQREKEGMLGGLERQVVFHLAIDGKKIGRFTADFVWEENGETVVADAKSEITRKETAYRLRKKLFEALYAPLTIREL